MKISRPETMSGKIGHLEKFLRRDISKLDEVKYEMLIIIHD